MYVTYFKFSHHPFARTPGKDPADSSRTLAAVFRDLRRALAVNRGLISLTAASGCGKTLLLRKLQTAALPERKRLLPLTHTWLAQPQHFDALQAVISSSQRTQLPPEQIPLRDLQHFLKGPQATSHRLIVIVDNAHLMPPEQLHRLLTLPLIRAGGRQPCRLLLAGNEELEPLIAELAPTSANPDQLDWAALRVAPMSALETQDYIEQRFSDAAAPSAEAGGVTLQPDATQAIAAYSCGILRTVHHLGHACLTLARQRQTHTLDVALVAEASRQLRLNRLPTRRLPQSVLSEK